MISNFKIKVGSDIKDGELDFNLHVSKMPIKLFPDKRPLPFETWIEHSGNDVFIPPAYKPTYDAFEIDVEFIYIGADNTYTQKIKEFKEFICNAGLFSFYTDYTKQGRQNVECLGAEEDLLQRIKGVDGDVFDVKVKLKVHDPKTLLNDQFIAI